jgi:Ca2+:H+ antiporter
LLSLETFANAVTIKNRIFLGLLLFVPLSLCAEFFHWGPIFVFVTAGIAILPLASWMGLATEEIAVVVGPTLGGLLNATFGNATELIIALIALKAGLIEVVKASITGSIIGNLLLVMGLSMFLGGLRYKVQTFQPVIARVNASLMNLAVIAILLPTAMHFTSPGIQPAQIQRLSSAVAVVLIVVYIFTLVFSMKTHSYLYDVGIAENEPSPSESKDSNPQEIPPRSETEGQKRSRHRPDLKLWAGVLLAATIAVAVESELLVGSLEVATKTLGLTPLFTGVILLPIIGNAAEHATAVTVAMKDKMDLSVSVAVGSSLQIALFVAPALVLAGWFFGQPMNLDFNPFELVAVMVSVLIANSISSDGQSNWLEGFLLLAAYLVLGLAFYFHPAT